MMVLEAIYLLKLISCTNNKSKLRSLNLEFERKLSVTGDYGILSFV